MAESSFPLGPIHVFEEFICQAIPGPGVAGCSPENAPASRVNNGETVTQDESPPHEASANGDAAAFRSQLDKLPTTEILTLVQKGGLSAEQVRAVREAVAARLSARQSEIQELRVILKLTSPT